MTKILNRWTGVIIHEDDAETMKETLWNALKTKADLSDANLSDANLSGANLSDANLSRANLSRADLSGANLSRADLSDANLSDANLSDANLSRANLSDANLSDADLSDANLSDANLSRADLRHIKADIWYILTQNRHEVLGLREALLGGKINGSSYTGECACLVGTIANIRKCSYVQLDPDYDRPAERWFLAIQIGDTPETSAVAAITLEWIDEWLACMGKNISAETTTGAA